MQHLKIAYSKAMIQLHLHFGKYLECAKCCQSMLGAEGVDLEAVFVQMITFLLLAPYCKDQQELTHQVLQDRRIKGLPILGDLIKIFCRKELIRWANVEQAATTANLFSADLFPAAGHGWKVELQKRVVEHVREASVFSIRCASM